MWLNRLMWGTRVDWKVWIVYPVYHGLGHQFEDKQRPGTMMLRLATTAQPARVAAKTTERRSQDNGVSRRGLIVYPTRLAGVMVRFRLFFGFCGEVK